MGSVKRLIDGGSSSRSQSRIAWLDVLLLAANSLLLLCPSVTAESSCKSNDVFFIKDEDCICSNGGIPMMVDANELPDKSGWEVSWKLLDQLNRTEVLYWVSSQSNFKVKSVMEGVDSTTLEGLEPYQHYNVAVRIICTDEENKVGSLSEIIKFRTSPGEILALVDGLKVVYPHMASASQARVVWNGLPDKEWNGDPMGYNVCVEESRSYDEDNPCSKDPQMVKYPLTQLIVQDLEADTDYTMLVQAMSSSSTGPYSSATFRTNAVESSGTNFWSSSFVYLIAPAVIFLIFIVAMAIVLVKREVERRKRRITYCSGLDIDSTGDASLKDLSFEGRRLGPNSNRPLPLSPGDHTHQQQLYSPNAVFPSDDQESGRLMSHPSTLPHLMEVEQQQAHPSHHAPVPMHRTNTNTSLSSSVFVGGPYPGTTAVNVAATTVATTPGAQQQSSRGPGRERTLTTTSMPSPYEVPEHGNTLPRNEGNGGGIPPPPNHSPPPLTQSSLALFNRMPGVTSRVPQRSHSTADGLGEEDHAHDQAPLRNQHRHQHKGRSTGHLPAKLKEVEEGGEGVGGGGGGEGAEGAVGERGGGGGGEDPEKLVYIQPPADSDQEPSIASGQGYKPSTLERRNRGARMPPGGGGGGGAGPPSGGSIGNFSDLNSPLSSTLPRTHHHPPSYTHHPPHPQHSHQHLMRRESEFSETSTEASYSGESLRMASPQPLGPNWDQAYPRATRSDVGGGRVHGGRRHNHSLSPDRPDHYSEVGAPSSVFNSNHDGGPRKAYMPNANGTMEKIDLEKMN